MTRHQCGRGSRLVFKHHGAPRVVQQMGAGGAGLDNCAARGQITFEHSDTRLRLEGLSHGFNNAGIKVFGACDVLADRTP